MFVWVYTCQNATLLEISNHNDIIDHSYCIDPGNLSNIEISILNLTCGSSVVECLTRDRRAAGSSLTGVAALWSLSKTFILA